MIYIFRLKHAQSELKKKQSELKNTEKSYKKDKDAHDAIEKSKAKLEVIFNFKQRNRKNLLIPFPADKCKY